MTQLKAMCNTCDAYTEFNRDGRCWRCMFEAAEKRAKDAEEREKQAYEGRKCSEEAAAFEANRLLEALAASQALTQRLENERNSAWEALRKIESASWDSGSTPPREVISRIYGIASKALIPSPAALAESPDHVAPAPEAHPPDCGCPKVPCSDPICSCRTTAAQEATASPAPERVCCFCGAGMSHGNFECPNSATILPAPPEEAAPQAQEEK